jgi:hypothetical protein
VFMLITDHHQNRTIEPFGNEVMVENFTSLISPVFGPFKDLFTGALPQRPQHFEGYSYLGIVSVLLAFCCLIFIIITWKRRDRNPTVFALFTAAFFVLLVAFGYHHKLLAVFDHKFPALSQFRAVCRFAWLFYFMLPLCYSSVLYSALSRISSKYALKIFSVTAVLFLAINIWEAKYMLNYNSEAFWKFRNFFNSQLLNTEEKSALQYINSTDAQAMLPLPMFHGGSEMYDRNGSSNSMVPSMLYSYHAGLPILSVMLSRTSITETEELLDVINSYKRNKPVLNKMNGKDVVVIKTKDELLEDEKRFLKKVTFGIDLDSCKMGKVSMKMLARNESPAHAVELRQKGGPFQQGCLYIKNENRKPFIPTEVSDEQKIFVVDSNKLAAGKYVVSFHYHHDERIFQDLAIDLIVTGATSNSYEWLEIVPVRKLSGFYPGYAVFEHLTTIEDGHKYEYILRGREKSSYHISDFIIRPESLDVYYVQKGDTVFNNFPSR